MKVKYYTHNLHKLPLYFNGKDMNEKALCYYDLKTNDGKDLKIMLITDKHEYEIDFNQYTVYEDFDKVLIETVYHSRKFINENYFRYGKH